jgi:hypothetical protein
MGVRIITTWPALFRLAHAEGKARLAFKANPSEENRAKLDAAIKEHEDYHQLCLKSDDMIGLPDISDVA